MICERGLVHLHDSVLLSVFLSQNTPIALSVVLLLVCMPSIIPVSVLVTVSRIFEAVTVAYR